MKKVTVECKIPDLSESVIVKLLLEGGYKLSCHKDFGHNPEGDEEWANKIAWFVPHSFGTYTVDDGKTFYNWECWGEHVGDAFQGLLDIQKNTEAKLALILKAVSMTKEEKKSCRKKA